MLCPTNFGDCHECEYFEDGQYCIYDGETDEKH